MFSGEAWIGLFDQGQNDFTWLDGTLYVCGPQEMDHVVKNWFILFYFIDLQVLFYCLLGEAWIGLFDQGQNDFTWLDGTVCGDGSCSEKLIFLIVFVTLYRLIVQWGSLDWPVWPRSKWFHLAGWDSVLFVGLRRWMKWWKTDLLYTIYSFLLFDCPVRKPGLACLTEVKIISPGWMGPRTVCGLQEMDHVTTHRTLQTTSCHRLVLAKDASCLKRAFGDRMIVTTNIN